MNDIKSNIMMHKLELSFFIEKSLYEIRQMEIDAGFITEDTGNIEDIKKQIKLRTKIVSSIDDTIKKYEKEIGVCEHEIEKLSKNKNTSNHIDNTIENYKNRIDELRDKLEYETDRKNKLEITIKKLKDMI